MCACAHGACACNHEGPRALLWGPELAHSPQAEGMAPVHVRDTQAPHF